MSHFNPNQHFDVENWRDQKIAQRTKDALAARDAAFAEKHAGTPCGSWRCIWPGVPAPCVTVPHRVRWTAARLLSSASGAGTQLCGQRVCRLHG